MNAQHDNMLYTGTVLFSAESCHMALLNIYSHILIAALTFSEIRQCHWKLIDGYYNVLGPSPSLTLHLTWCTTLVWQYTYEYISDGREVACPATSIQS